MQYNRLPLRAMRTFAAAAKHGSFVEAARELYVTHSAISHQIRSLEEDLGAPLFDRGTRPIRLTQAGELLSKTVNDCLLKLQNAVRAIQHDEIETELTISCVPGVAANWLVPNLGRFLSMNAKIAVHVVTEYWQHPGISEQSDLAVVYGSAEHAGKRVVLLGHSEHFPVCSPEFLAVAPSMETPADILNHTLLHVYGDESWSRWFALVGVENTAAARHVHFDAAHLSLAAARAGYGVAMGDMGTCSDDIACGRLERLFDAAVPAAYPYCLVAKRAADQSAAARALEEWLVSEFPLSVSQTTDAVDLREDITLIELDSP